MGGSNRNSGGARKTKRTRLPSGGRSVTSRVLDSIPASDALKRIMYWGRGTLGGWEEKLTIMPNVMLSMWYTRNVIDEYTPRAWRANAEIIREGVEKLKPDIILATSRGGHDLLQAVKSGYVPSNVGLVMVNTLSGVQLPRTHKCAIIGGGQDRIHMPRNLKTPSARRVQRERQIADPRQHFLYFDPKGDHWMSGMPDGDIYTVMKRTHQGNFDGIRKELEGDV